MRKIFILAKTLLKGGGAFSGQKNRKLKYLMPVILLFALVMFGFSMVLMTFGMYDALSEVGIQDIILPFVFGATCVVVFIFGIFYVVSTMYHAKDIDMLRALPLKPFQILGAKFVTLVIYEYILEAYILLPVLVGFGIKSGAGISYIIYALLLLLATPTIGLSIASLIVMIVMRFTSFGKNKQVFNFVGSILILALALGLNFGMQKLGNISQEQIAAIMSGQSSIVSVVSNIFPGVIFASQALLESSSLAGLGNLVLYLACCAAGIAVFLGAGQLLYFKGVIGITESAAKRKGVQDIRKETLKTSSTSAYLKKEFRMLVRSPIGFMQCVLTNIMWPVLIAIMFFSGDGLDGIKQLLVAADPKFVIMILVGMSAVISSTNPTASTSISREGKAFYISKYIPLAISKQLSAKIITGFVLSVFGTIIICVMAAVLGLSIVDAAIALLLGLAVGAVLSVAGVLIDSAHPKLEWMNEQQAIKQNLNVLLHTIVGVVIAAVLILPVWLLPMSFAVSILYMAAILVVILIILLRMVNTKAAKRIAEMDV